MFRLSGSTSGCFDLMWTSQHETQNGIEQTGHFPSESCIQTQHLCKGGTGVAGSYPAVDVLCIYMYAVDVREANFGEA